MAYFQGGDFVELLSAQGKSPAAAWKLQGKISKTFDKGIKGNAFQLDGNSETKMQLPKTASSSLGLAQRFVVLQLLVPFTRPFSVEICFSDFQKVRRRFVVASAFRDTARTALHVQLPLSAADVPRDQWLNLVFDLQTLSEIYFPDTSYRSMESICVSGSCCLKRIFTMKDAPTPSRAQVVRHADIRDIPRQFVFSATQRGASEAVPVPTQYFTMEPLGGVGVHGVAITANNSAVSNGTPKTGRRSQTAPVKAQSKPSSKGARAVRPESGLLHHKPLVQSPSATQLETDVDKPRDPPRQRLRTPARVSTTGSKLRQPQSQLGKVVTAKPSQKLDSPTLRLHGGHRRAFEEERGLEMPEHNLRGSVSPVQVSKLQDRNEEITRSAVVSPQTEDDYLDHDRKPTSSVRSTSVLSSMDKKAQNQVQSQTLRQSILGEIQQKLASLEDEDERADQRDRGLFLRHTSLHSGEWHLQQLCDEDLDDDNDETLLSDDGDDHIQLSSSWKRELNDPISGASIPSREVKQRPSHDDGEFVKTSMVSRDNANQESIFSFPSLVEQRTTPDRRHVSRLFDFDSLLQDVKPLAPQVDKVPSTRSETESISHTQLETRIEGALSDSESDADDLELTKLLAAKRSARRQLPPTQVTKDEDEQMQRLSTTREDELENDNDNLHDDTQGLMPPYGAGDVVDEASERDDWVVIEKDTADVMNDTTIDATRVHDAIQDKEYHLNQQAERDDDSDIDLGDDMNGLSIDLTSELSASGGESVHDLRDVGDYESSIRRMGPRSPGSGECKLESNHDNRKSLQLDDHDGDSSFDFEDLVEDAESSDDRDEDEEKHTQTALTVFVGKKSSHQKPAFNATRQSKDPAPTISNSPRGNQLTQMYRGATPTAQTRLSAVNSPRMDSPPSTGNRDKLLHLGSQDRPSKPSHCTDLSSSFSSHRLQRLLESTDWTAELNAQASSLGYSNPHVLPPARSGSRNQKSSHHRSPASSTDVQRSAAKGSSMHRSSQRTSSRPHTPSTSSIDLVYDPLLRCYYDPVANKYYALAE